MNAKAMAAIAITLILTCPLMLGYAMSFEEEEVQSWQTTSQASISDLLLNSEQNYYLDSYATANNASVYQQIYYASGGATETTSQAVDWNRTSSKVTSQAIATEHSGYVDLTATNTTSYTPSSTGGSYGWGGSLTTVPSTAAWVRFSFNSSEYYPSALAGGHYFGLSSGTTTLDLSVYSVLLYIYGGTAYVAELSCTDSSLNLSGVAYQEITSYELRLTKNLGQITVTYGQWATTDNNTTVYDNSGNTSKLPTAWTGTVSQPILKVTDTSGSTTYQFLTNRVTETVSVGTMTESDTITLSSTNASYGYMSGGSLATNIPDNAVRVAWTFPTSTTAAGMAIGLHLWIYNDNSATALNGVTGITFTVTTDSDGKKTFALESDLTTSNTGTLAAGYTFDGIRLWTGSTSGGPSYDISYVYTLNVYKTITTDRPITGVASIMVSGSTVVLTASNTSITLSDVAKVEISSVVSDSSISVRYYAADSTSATYAEAAYGWKLPNSSLTVQRSWWYNFQQNGAVRLMLDLSNVTGTITIDPTNTLSASDTSHLITITRTSDSPLSVAYMGATEDLGAYSYLMVNVEPSSWAVYGLTEWPAMTTTPTTYNVVSGTYEDLGAFLYIGLGGTGWSAASYRVDYASIVAGTFPSTKDLTYNPAEKFPGSYTVYINSVGVYGTSISFAGQTWTVNENYQIELNGRQTGLKGAAFTSWKQDGATEYRNTFNGVEIGTSSEPATITFGGEWSLTATQYKMEDVTETDLKWQPGVFAFDKQDFGIAALIMAFLAFIGLGASRPFNGGKIAILGLVCAITAGVIISIM